MILDFVFPHLCVACKQFSEERHLLCEVCVETVELLGRGERCGRCFRKKRGRRCAGCAQELFVRKAAVFEGGGPIATLLWDQERFAKTIAAFFVIHLIRLAWPMPAAIYFPRSFKHVGKKVMRYLNLPFFSNEPTVLCLSATYEESDIPPELYFSNLFFIAFTISD